MKISTDDSLSDPGLRARLKDLEQLFELSNDLLAVADFEGYFRRLNPAWTRVLGYGLAELMERPFLDFVHPDDVEATHGLAAAIYKSDGESRLQDGTFENRYRCLDGSYRWISWTWTADAKTRLIYAVARDVTAKKAREIRLRQTIEQVRDSNAQLESFASVASHDMREPLRMIANYLKLFRERYPDLLDDKGRRYISYATEGAERLRRMIDDLLAYASLGACGTKHRAVDLAEVVAEVLTNLEVLIRETGARINVEGDWPEVEGDPIRLARLMQNFIGNALKFRHPDRAPVVSLRCEEGSLVGEPGMWNISVSDNGIGIDPEYHEYLFVLFRRLHTADEYEGSGIGLAVCRKIAEQHGGRVWFMSDPGAGSTFYFSISKQGEAAAEGPV